MNQCAFFAFPDLDFAVARAAHYDRVTTSSNRNAINERVVFDLSARRSYLGGVGAREFDDFDDASGLSVLISFLNSRSSANDPSSIL